MEYHQQIQYIVDNGRFGDLIEFSFPVGFSHWGVYDGEGHVTHFAVADEAKSMKKFRDFLQKVVPLSGDILLGVTKIRRQPIAEVNVPKGASVMISNNRHTYRPCQKSEIKQRQDALLGKDLHYKLFSLNCEHFATFVRYGVAVCNQIPARTKNKKSKEATQTFQRLML
ncbi:phospholipase A and acyltransferase 2-like [Clupea harengus]|uniref:Phospholipase A and acyltransferase 2-like n=1 Tax=Clupea harengus TaxID=7950 RepID=A0A6P3W4V6_CLUHA|nr:phospholipase A and acyltransferase 2-like [Clupea harengus]